MRIDEIQAAGALHKKLTSIGLHRGATVRVLMRGDGDSHLIAIDNNRLGLDGAMSRAIRVRRSGIDIIPPLLQDQETHAPTQQP